MPTVRAPLERKHVHKWALTKQELTLDLERRCSDCRAVQHAKNTLASVVLNTPKSLLAFADVEWVDGALPPTQCMFGPFGGYWP